MRETIHSAALLSIYLPLRNKNPVHWAEIALGQIQFYN
jgi:hypothetical protein